MKKKKYMTRSHVGQMESHDKGNMLWQISKLKMKDEKINKTIWKNKQNLKQMCHPVPTYDFNTHESIPPNSPILIFFFL